MPTYFIDDAGDNSDGSTWAKAYSSVYAMLNHGTAPRGTSGVPFAAGDLVYIGNDTVDAASYTANTTIYGSASGLPVTFISSTVGAGSAVSYSASATRQIDTSNNGANTYALIFDGSCTFYGIYMMSGGSLTLTNDTNETIHLFDCYLKPGANSSVFGGTDNTNQHMQGGTIDCALDGTTGRSASIVSCQTSSLHNVALVNVAYRTGAFYQTTGAKAGCGEFSGIDLTGLTNGTLCELVTASSGKVTVTNCITAATWAPLDGTSRINELDLLVTNTGPEDSPTYLYHGTYTGNTLSSSAIYRTGGATVEGTACSWLITTTAVCGESAPYYTPWIYGVVSSTGSRTFTLYITNDTADFDNSQVWLEVEYLSTSDEAIWALGSDQRDNSTGAFISITEAVDTQTDDTTSTWNEFTGSGTYSQTATVVTVTDTAHGLRTGDAVVVDVTGTGGVTDGTYTVTSTADADTFTFTASTGNGSGTLTWQMAPLYSYKQELSVTATVNETGQFRARVAVGVASIAGSRYFYVDPKITVT